MFSHPPTFHSSATHHELLQLQLQLQLQLRRTIRSLARTCRRLDSQRMGHRRRWTFGLPSFLESWRNVSEATLPVHHVNNISDLSLQGRKARIWQSDFEITISRTTPGELLWRLSSTYHLTDLLQKLKPPFLRKELQFLTRHHHRHHRHLRRHLLVSFPWLRFPISDRQARLQRKQRPAPVTVTRRERHFESK